MDTPSYDTRILDRQVGRNAQLFARSIAERKDTPEARFPYLRILVSVIELAHPEWNQAPQKDVQIARLAWMMSGRTLDQDEIAQVVRARDEERGLFYD